MGGTCNFHGVELFFFFSPAGSKSFVLWASQSLVCVCRWFGEKNGMFCPCRMKRSCRTTWRNLLVSMVTAPSFSVKASLTGITRLAHSELAWKGTRTAKQGKLLCSRYWKYILVSFPSFFPQIAVAIRVLTSKLQGKSDDFHGTKFAEFTMPCGFWIMYSHRSHSSCNLHSFESIHVYREYDATCFKRHNCAYNLGSMPVEFKQNEFKISQKHIHTFCTFSSFFYASEPPWCVGPSQRKSLQKVVWISRFERPHVFTLPPAPLSRELWEAAFRWFSSENKKHSKPVFSVIVWRGWNIEPKGVYVNIDTSEVWSPCNWNPSLFVDG